jgi:hypothetical protein
MCEHFVSEMKVVRSKCRSGRDCKRLKTACVATAHMPAGVVLGGKETAGSLTLVFFQSSSS